jgi:hypothetical protein
MANLMVELNNPMEALKQYKKCIELLKVNKKINTSECAALLSNMAVVCGDLGFFAEGIHWCEESVKIQRRIHGPHVDSVTLDILSDLKKQAARKGSSSSSPSS